MTVEIVGFAGAALMVATLAMRTMIPLRAVGIASSCLQIIFAALTGIVPMLIQHCILLPMNAYRLYEQVRLVRKVRAASSEGLSMDCLMPFMTKRRVEAGRILFHKGEPADKMFIVTSGRLRLSEMAMDVLPGNVVGELGLLAPNQQRTQTLECIEDAEIMQINYDRIKALYFENPSFGFYFLRLTSGRLFQNIAALEKELEERSRQIQHLRPSQAAPIQYEPPTGDAKRLRAYATRLMAFGLKAVSDGDTDFAERFTARASECLDRAQAMEGLATDRRTSSSSK